MSRKILSVLTVCVLCFSLLAAAPVEGADINAVNDTELSESAAEVFEAAEESTESTDVSEEGSAVELVPAESIEPQQEPAVDEFAEAEKAPIMTASASAQVYFSNNMSGTKFAVVSYKLAGTDAWSYSGVFNAGGTPGAVELADGDYEYAMSVSARRSGGITTGKFTIRDGAPVADSLTSSSGNASVEAYEGGYKLVLGDSFNNTNNTIGSSIRG